MKLETEELKYQGHRINGTQEGELLLYARENLGGVTFAVLIKRPEASYVEYFHINKSELYSLLGLQM